MIDFHFSPTIGIIPCAPRGLVSKMRHKRGRFPIHHSTRQKRSRISSMTTGESRLPGNTSPLTTVLLSLFFLNAGNTLGQQPKLAKVQIIHDLCEKQKSRLFMIRFKKKKAFFNQLHFSKKMFLRNKRPFFRNNIQELIEIHIAI